MHWQRYDDGLSECYLIVVVKTSFLCTITVCTVFFYKLLYRTTPHLTDENQSLNGCGKVTSFCVFAVICVRSMCQFVGRETKYRSVRILCIQSYFLVVLLPTVLLIDKAWSISRAVAGV